MSSDQPEEGYQLDESQSESGSDIESDSSEEMFSRSPAAKINEGTEKKDISNLYRYEKGGLIIYDSHSRVCTGYIHYSSLFLQAFYK